MEPCKNNALDTLHHIPESEVHDYAASDTLAGQDIHLAMHMNAGPVQNDRAGVVSLEGVRAEAMAEVGDYASAYANMAVYQERIKPDAPQSVDRATSSTMTLGIYDPESFQLWLRTCGDSPAYLVLNDPDAPEKSGAILLAQEDRVVGKHNTLGNYLGICEELEGGALEPATYCARVHLPPHRTPPAIDINTGPTAPMPALGDTTTKPVSADTDFVLADDVLAASLGLNEPPQHFTVVKQEPVDLQALVEEAKARLELGPNTTASLLFTSDSLLQNGPQTLGHPAYFDKLAAHVAEAMSAENPAQALAEKFRSFGVVDNESLILLPNIAKGKGAAMAAMIFDGMGQNSGIMAQAAADGVTEYLLGYVKAHVPAAGLDSLKELQQPPQGLDRTNS